MSGILQSTESKQNRCPEHLPSSHVDPVSGSYTISSPQFSGLQIWSELYNQLSWFFTLQMA